MFVKLLCIVFSAVVLNVVENARILDRVKRESLKVRITAKDDSIVFQYLAPDPAIKLRGYILGYGGRYSKQNISLPDNGEPIELDVEFTPKYLIAVHPVAEYSRAAALKRCKGSVELHQPLQVMINALTSTSVLLSWGQNYEEECNGDVDSECTDERHFTIRYREKEKNRKWMYQFCPTTNTVVDKLRPNTAYEFGVRVTKPKEDSIWSKTTARTTTVTTSPSNTRTQQMRINVLHPYGNVGKSKNTRNRQTPGGDHQNSGKARRKSAMITSAPGTDPSVFMKTNRNPPSKAHNRMELNPQPENDVVNKEEKNVIDPKGTKMDKTGKTKPKTAGSPSKANESTRPSSVNTSFPSNPEFQVPSSNHSNLFTSERDSDLETKDKQHSTESEIPPSAKIPLTILSTTSKLTAEDKQKLPEIKAPSSTSSFLNTSDPVSAFDLVDNKQSKEPEAPHSSRSSIHPASEPDAKDMEKLTDFEIPTASTSFFSISKLTSTLDVTDGQKSTEKVTELERPSSNGNFYSIPSSTSERDTTDEQFSERGVTSSSSSFFTTSPAELDPAERQPDSEDEIRSSSSSSFNGLNTLKPDVLDKEKNTGLGVPSSSNSFPFTANTSESNALGNQKSTELEAPSSTSSVFITSNTHAEADVIKHNPFTEYNPPLANNPPRTESDYQDKQPITDLYQSSVESSSHLNLNPVLETDAPDHRVHTDQEHDIPFVFSPTLLAEHISAGNTQSSERKLSTADTPHMFSGTPVSELDKIEENQDHMLSTADTRYVISPMPVPELDKIIRSESKDHIVPTADTPYVFSGTPLYKLENIEDNKPSSGFHSTFYDMDHIVPTTDTPYVFSGAPVFEPENIEDTLPSGTHKKIHDMENKLSTANTPHEISGTTAHYIEDYKFTDHKAPTFDTPHTFSGIPVTERTNIEDSKPTDHKEPTVESFYGLSRTPLSELDNVEDGKSTDHTLTTADTPLIFSGAAVSELDNTQDHKLTDDKASTTDSTYVFSGISAKERDNIGGRKTIDHKLPTADTPHAFSETPVTELDKIEDNKQTDHKGPTPNTPYVLNGASISYLDNVKDRNAAGRKPSTAGTPHEFSGSSASGLDKLEDNSSPDRKLSTAKTSHVFSGTGVSEVDNLADNNPTDPERSTSDTVQVFRPSQLDSTGEKKRKGTDPAADSSSSKPKNKTNAKLNVLETSAGVQSSMSSNPFSEKDAVRPTTQATYLCILIENSEFENGTVMSSTPISEIDSLGKPRFTGAHVKYCAKNPSMPCSISEALKYFAEKNHTNVKVTTVPRYAPTNVTILTIEGCPTFVIVDWEKNDNDSATEFELVSTALGPDNETEKIVTITNQTHSAVENLSPNTSYVFVVKPKNKLGVGPPSDPVPFVTESADPRVSEYVPGKAAIWSPYRFKFDSFSQCQGKQYVKRTWYRKFVGIILCNSLRYKIYLSDKLSGVFYNIGDLSGHGEDHCQFVDSFLDGRTGHHLLSAQLPVRQGFYRSLRQEPVMFGTIGGHTHISYVHWYECGIAIPGKW